MHFIDSQLRPTDEVGLLSYSTMKSLILHEYLTTDHQKIREIVEGFGVRDVLGRAEDMEEQYWRTATGIESTDASRKSQPFEDAFLKQTQIPKTMSMRKFSPYIYQASNFSIKIKDLAKALRYVPGHKHIILFSSGVASSVLYGIGAPLKRDCILLI